MMPRRTAKFGACETCACVIDISATHCQMHMNDRNGRARGIMQTPADFEVWVAPKKTEEELRELQILDLAEEIMRSAIDKVERMGIKIRVKATEFSKNFTTLTAQTTFQAYRRSVGAWRNGTQENIK